MNTNMHEKKGISFSGWVGILLVILLGVILLIVNKIASSPGYNYIKTMSVVSILTGMLAVLILTGLFTIQPNTTVVLMFFGHYVGTVKAHGLRWTFPFFSKRAVSLRIRNFETNKSKVNDNQGNPVEVAGIIVWRVVDTAQALFHVSDYTHFVYTQAEAALRGLIMRYPYGDFENDSVSLVTHTDEVSEKLREETQQRLDNAGIEIIETRISHMAYSPEIAAVMLKRQQANAVIAARKKIVEGAVGVVESAFEIIKEKQIVDFSEQEKAKLASNLLVILSSEQNVQPTLGID